jgi:hypothetical protein
MVRFSLTFADFPSSDFLNAIKWEFFSAQSDFSRRFQTTDGDGDQDLLA